MRIFGPGAWIRDLSRAGLGLAFLLGLAACAGAQEQTPAYRVGELQAGDKVSITTTGRDVVVDIRSETGIGNAEIERITGPAPEMLLLRFHLAGLEELVLTCPDVQVTLHVSSHGDANVSQEVRSPTVEAQIIGPDSPYWMAVRIPEGQRIPLTDGAIEVSASRTLLESDIRRFSLRWIDFYR